MQRCGQMLSLVHHLPRPRPSDLEIVPPATCYSRFPRSCWNPGIIKFSCPHASSEPDSVILLQLADMTPCACHWWWWHYHFCDTRCQPEEGTKHGCLGVLPHPHSWMQRDRCCSEAETTSSLWSRTDSVLKIRLMSLFKAAIYFMRNHLPSPAFYSQKKNHSF